MGEGGIRIRGPTAGRGRRGEKAGGREEEEEAEEEAREEEEIEDE